MITIIFIEETFSQNVVFEKDLKNQDPKYMYIELK